jgi:uncharacterized membrane protein YphA (DoxX/SURF4 family)
MPPATERRAPLSASRRYYPGFFGALFLVLLRMAIGWHFFHEGHEKWTSSETGDSPFSAEGYLRAATGPLAPHFRALIPDPESLALIDPVGLKAAWEKDLDRASGHYEFDPAQREKAQKALAQTQAEADAWFEDRENLEKIKLYRNDLEQVRQREVQGPKMSFEQERLQEDRKELEQTRRGLVAPIVAWSGALHESWQKLATPEQRQRAGALPPPETTLERVNQITTYGLMAVGLCLMLGLLSRLAALGAAGYLLLFYLSMPPWPGLPASPMAEGHYLYVNKNLIEMFACLALAATPTGSWIGLDALLFGWIGRRRSAGLEPAAGSATVPDADLSPAAGHPKSHESHSRSDR